MKRKFNFLNRVSPKNWLLMLTCMALGAPNSDARPGIVPPLNADQTLATIYTAGNLYLNNALMDYYCNSGGELMACSYYEYYFPPTSCVATATLNPAAGFIINDGVNAPISTTIPTPGPNMVVAECDIMLGGNNLPFRNTTFYAGVVYTVLDSIANTTNIYLSVYEIDNPGGSLTVTPMCLNLQLSTNGECAYPHIDGITKDFPGIPGYVKVDNFFVSYKQYSGSGWPDLISVYCNGLEYVAYNCALPSSAITVNVTNKAITGLYGDLPDVAGIERTVGSNIDDIALFTFVDPTNPMGVYYQEWDATAGTFSARVDMNTSTSSYISGLSNPRIDAIDYHTMNLPSNGFANYNIVSTNNTILNQNIYSYNNITVQNCSAFPPFSGWLNGGGTIACGPGHQYTTAYYTNDGPGDIYAQTIDWATGNFTSPGTYLLVNSVPGPALFPAISSDCNAIVSQYIYTCWYNPSLGEIDYKISGNPVAFRQGQAPGTGTVPAKWTLTPNPADDHIVLTASTTDFQNAGYRIEDVVGRVMMQGSLTAPQLTISVSALPAGVYTVHITGKSDDEVIKFVKQ